MRPWPNMLRCQHRERIQFCYAVHLYGPGVPELGSLDHTKSCSLSTSHHETLRAETSGGASEIVCG